MSTFNILSATYEKEMGSTVETTLDDEYRTFIVQLAGGEHLTQMGCWLLTDDVDGDVSDDDVPDYAAFFSEIIKAGEKAYNNYVTELTDAENWETIEETNSHMVSATSSTSCLLQKKTNFDEDADDYEYRVIPENNGFTQPNDYSSCPDFTVEEFFSLESAQEWLNMGADERAYHRNLNE